MHRAVFICLSILMVMSMMEGQNCKIKPFIKHHHLAHLYAKLYFIMQVEFIVKYKPKATNEYQSNASSIQLGV